MKRAMAFLLVGLAVTTCAVQFSFAQPLGAQPAYPQARAGGEYWQRSECSWPVWQVLAKELPGRLSPKWPESMEDPSALLHLDWNVPRWPAVATFNQGEILTAVPDEVGGIFIKDIDGASWLRVTAAKQEVSQTDSSRADLKVCFVRAHKKYLKPHAS